MSADPFNQIRPLLAWMELCTATECHRLSGVMMPPEVLAAIVQSNAAREALALSVWNASSPRIDRR